MNWQQLLWGDLDATFLSQIGIRTCVIFVIQLFALSILGKRGVKQLSIFEFVIIISFVGLLLETRCFKKKLVCFLL
jgi:uncharacterized membrane protein YcaP (DUF421 family)